MVEAEARTPRDKLPLLKEGSRSLFTGTYLAEQTSSVSYDLVSAGAAQSRAHIGRAGAISPGPEGSAPSSPRELMKRVRKKASSKFVKCTQLPALENIDTLFKSREDEAPEGRGGDTPESIKLEKIEESPDGEEDDLEFKEWLKLPSISASPRTDASDSTWHVLLSHKTFHTSSEKHVRACLEQALSFDQHAAWEKVTDLKKRRLSVVGMYNDKSEAFRIMQKLRSLGLQVQVVMDCGLPGEGHTLERRGRRQSKQQPSSAFMRSYTELFFKAGADKSTGRMTQVSSGEQLLSKSRVGLAQWRFVQSEGFEQTVLPEDAVEGYFADERLKLIDGSNAQSLFEAIVTKHKNTLKQSERSLRKSRATKAKPDLADQFLKAMRRSNHEKTEPRKESVYTQAFSERSTLHHGSSLLDPNSVNFSAEALKPKEATPARKEACLLLRFFIFGNFGDEENQDREELFHERIGTRDQVKTLYRMWGALDDDSSGRVDFSEFRSFVEGHMRDLILEQHTQRAVEPIEAPKSPRKAHHDNLMHLRYSPRRQGQHGGVTMVLQTTSASDLMAQAVEDTGKFCAALCEKLSIALLGKKSSFVIEDMMRLIWLFTTQVEVRIMRTWCREFLEEAMRNRVDTPPILDSVEYEGLCSVFEHFDEERHGEILFDTLVSKGLIYQEQIEEYKVQWDGDGNGVLSLGEFCDMMCPVGFRATAKSEIGSRPDGRRVLYDHNIGGWKLERLPEGFSEIYRDFPNVGPEIRAEGSHDDLLQ